MKNHYLIKKLLLAAFVLLGAINNSNSAMLAFNFNDSVGEVGEFILDTSYVDTDPALDKGNYSINAISNFSYRGGVVTGVYTIDNNPGSTLSLGFDNGSWSTDISLWFWPTGVDLVNQFSSDPDDYVSTGGIIYIDGIGSLNFENVTVSSVPIPGAFPLFLSGIVMIALRRKKYNKHGAIST